MTCLAYENNIFKLFKLAMNFAKIVLHIIMAPKNTLHNTSPKIFATMAKLFAGLSPGLRLKFTPTPIINMRQYQIDDLKIHIMRLGNKIRQYNLDPNIDTCTFWYLIIFHIFLVNN